MSKTTKKMTAEEFMAGQERTAAVRLLVSQANVGITSVAHYAGISGQTYYQWTRMGLTPDQYDRLLRAIERAKAD